MGKPHNTDLDHLRITFPPQGPVLRPMRMAPESSQDLAFVFDTFPWIVENELFADPVVGTNLVVTLPVLQQWRVQSFRWLLTTDANAANRFTRVALANAAGDEYYVHDFLTATTASQAIGFTAADQPQTTGPSGSQNVPLPANIIMRPGDTLSLIIINIQAGDQLSEPTMQRERRVDFSG